MVPVFLCPFFAGHFSNLAGYQVNMIKLGIIHGVEYALSVACGLHEAGFAQDGQVLRSNGLLDTQLGINVGDNDPAVLMNELQELLAQGVIYCTKYKGCFF